MISIHTLASGSEGNSLLVQTGRAAFLVDAGISARRITNSLAPLGLGVDDLSAILITHEHTDHIAGLQTLVKHHRVPICATPGTARQLAYRIAGIQPLLQEVSPGAVLSVADCRLTCFSTSHDAAQSADWRIDGPGGSVGVLTDTGYVTEEARAALAGVDLLVLESNHDPEWVISGPYPYPLKQRILGPLGHLSNEDAAAFARQMALSGTGQILLAHLSRENNTPSRALEVVCRAVSDLAVTVEVAPRSELSRCYRVEECLCRK